MSAAVLVVLFLPTWVADFRDANARTFGPNWSQEVGAARAQCTSGTTAQVRLDIDPSPWFTVIPCHYLVRGAPTPAT